MSTPSFTHAPRPGSRTTFAGHSVSRIGYGAMQLERLEGDRPSAIALLRRALELGVDHIDTAHFYGDGAVNGIISEAIGSHDGVVVATKVGANPNPGGAVPLRPAQKPEELRQSVEDNLRSLGVEQLQVVYLRRLDVGPGITADGDQVVDLDDQLAEMTAMRDEGMIGAIGVSSIDTRGLLRALPAGIVGVQNRYSLVSREFERMLQLSTDAGVAWVPFFPLGGAFPGTAKVVDQPQVQTTALAHRATASQIGLAWLLSHSPDLLLIPGTTSPAHLTENLAAGEILLDDTELAALDGLDRLDRLDGLDGLDATSAHSPARTDGER